MGEMPLYPMRFESIYQYRLWGGQRLAGLLTTPLSPALDDERTFAWLGNFGCLVVRWERRLPMYPAHLYLACLLNTLRRS